MKITAAQAAGELLSKNRILILSHASPDGDTLGCAFALWNALTALGKQARVACSDDFPARFSWLYEGYSPADFSPEYVVAVDIAAKKLLGDPLSDYSERVDLCVDHHPSNEFFAGKNCVIPEAAACCEILFEVIEAMKVPVTPQIASCLYTGLATDTGCFKFSNTTGNTHRIAAALMEQGADFRPINELLFDTKSKSRLAIEQMVLSSLAFWGEDRIAVACISREMLVSSQADEGELDGVSAIPRSIEGVMVGITLREKSELLWKASVRTGSQVNAGELCALFDGGGHARAAGCVVEGDFETVRGRLVAAAMAHLPAEV